MADDPDMMSIGEHCALPDCHALDFLPFKCSSCHRTYCLEHRSHDAHRCPAHSAKEDVSVVPCPLCAQGVRVKAGEDPNAAFERHSRSGDCDPKNYERVHRKPKCQAPGCRERLNPVNEYTCKVCMARVCLKHRLESDHACQGKAVHTLGTAAAQRQGVVSAAGAAAAAGRSLGSRASTLLAAALGNGGAASAGARPTAQQQRQQERQRHREHQQQQQRAARPAQPDPANTVHGTAARRRQLLGLPEQPAGLREQCPQCSSRFASVHELIQHVEAAHGDGGGPATQHAQQQQQPSTGGSEVFACPGCGERFGDAVRLVSHSEQCGRAAAVAAAAAAQPSATCVLS